jgi:hypothetical protein
MLLWHSECLLNRLARHERGSGSTFAHEGLLTLRVSLPGRKAGPGEFSRRVRRSAARIQVGCPSGPRTRQGLGKVGLFVIVDFRTFECGSGGL